MIVRMKKLLLVLHHRARHDFLEGLQHAGVVHLTQTLAPDAPHIHASADAMQEKDRIHKALAHLRRATPAQRRDKTPQEVIEQFNLLSKTQEALDQTAQQLMRDEAILAPWGDFDPALVEALTGAGVTLRFYQCPVRKFASLDTSSAENIEEIARHQGQALFVAVFAGGEQARIDAEEVHLPATSLGEVRASLACNQAEQNRVAGELDALGAYADLVAECCAEETNRHSLLTAEAGLVGAAGDRLFWATGYFPEEKTAELVSFLENQPVTFEITDPQPDDNVPVLVRNGPLTRLYEPLLRLYSTPAYTDLDPTIFIAPFFTLFVGLCIGDLAYGALIVLGCGIAWFRVSAKVKPFMTLGIILGVMTVLAGLMLNSAFGRAIFGGPDVTNPIFPSGESLAYFHPHHDAQGTAYPMMNFALFIGFVQVSLAFILRTANKFRNGAISDGLSVFSFLVMLIGALAWCAQVNFLNLHFGSFSINTLHIGKLLLLIPKNVGIGLMLAGLVMFMVFGNRDKPLGGRIAQNLLDFYNGVTGIFGNILSYLRLFALGLAGGMLAMVFNQLAFMLVTDSSGQIHYLTPMIIATVLLLVFGHTLNFALCLVGAFVHPLRLTFVEFLQNIDMAWGGQEYAPFARVRADNTNN